MLSKYHWNINKKYWSNIFNILSKYLPNIVKNSQNIDQILKICYPDIIEIWSTYHPNIASKIFMKYLRNILKCCPKLIEILSKSRLDIVKMFHNVIEILTKYYQSIGQILSTYYPNISLILPNIDKMLFQYHWKIFQILSNSRLQSLD